MPRIGTQPLADQPLGGLPSTNDRRPPLRHWPPASAGRQVPTFHTGAQTKLAPPSCRTPPGQSAGTRQTHPGPARRARFRCRPYVFDASSVVRSRSPSWPTPDALTGAPSPRRSAPRLLTGAPRGGLRPPPAGRPRRPTSPRWAGPSISDATPHHQSSLLQPDLLMRSWNTRAHILWTRNSQDLWIGVSRDLLITTL